MMQSASAMPAAEPPQAKREDGDILPFYFCSPFILLLCLGERSGRRKPLVLVTARAYLSLA
jgi:hypothetical protein